MWLDLKMTILAVCRDLRAAMKMHNSPRALLGEVETLEWIVWAEPLGAEARVMAEMAIRHSLADLEIIAGVADNSGITEAIHLAVYTIKIVLNDQFFVGND